MEHLSGAQKMAEALALLNKEIDQLLKLGATEAAKLLSSLTLDQLELYLEHIHARQAPFARVLIFAMSRSNSDRLQRLFLHYKQAVSLLEGMSIPHLVEVLEVLYPANALAVIQSLSDETISRTIDGTPQRVSRAVILLERMNPDKAAEVLSYDPQRGNGWWGQMCPDKAQLIKEAMKMVA